MSSDESSDDDSCGDNDRCSEYNDDVDEENDGFVNNNLQTSSAFSTSDYTGNSLPSNNYIDDIGQYINTLIDDDGSDFKENGNNHDHDHDDEMNKKDIVIERLSMKVEDYQAHEMRSSFYNRSWESSDVNSKPNIGKTEILEDLRIRFDFFNKSLENNNTTINTENSNTSSNNTSTSKSSQPDSKLKRNIIQPKVPINQSSTFKHVYHGRKSRIISSSDKLVVSDIFKPDQLNPSSNTITSTSKTPPTIESLSTRIRPVTSSSSSHARVRVRGPETVTTASAVYCLSNQKDRLSPLPLFPKVRPGSSQATSTCGAWKKGNWNISVSTLRKHYFFKDVKPVDKRQELIDKREQQVMRIIQMNGCTSKTIPKMTSKIVAKTNQMFVTNLSIHRRQNMTNSGHSIGNSSIVSSTPSMAISPYMPNWNLGSTFVSSYSK